MVAIVKPPVDGKKIKPDLSLLMDFEKDQGEIDNEQAEEPSSSPYSQTSNMGEETVTGKVNKLYDFDKELKLLNQYAGDIQDQPEKDYANENRIRSALLNYQNSQLRPEQIEKIQEEDREAKFVSRLLGTMRNVYRAYGYNHQPSDSRQRFKEAGEDWSRAINAPIKKAEILQNQYLKDAANAKTLSDVERGNLSARGKDLENFSSANKQIMTTIDAKKKADPSSEDSKMARELLINSLRQAQDYANLPEGMGGEKRARYRELAPFYADMAQAAAGASYNEAERIAKLVEAKDKETGRRVGEDLREMGAKLQAERLGAMLGQNDFNKRKALVDTAEETAQKQDALNTMMRVYELAQSPEVQKGFGTMTLGRIMEMSRKGMTPLQTEFQQLVAKANSKEVKDNYGVSFNSGEQKQAWQYLPTADDSVPALLTKVNGAMAMGAKGLHNAFSKHYGLSTGRSFSRDFGVEYDPEHRSFTSEQINRMRHMNPFDMLNASGGNTVSVQSSKTTKESGNATTKSKVMKASDIDFLVEQTGKPREQVIKEAKSHGYVVRE